MSFIAPIPYLVSAKPRTFRPKRVTAARTARHRRRGGSFDAPSRLGRVTPALDQSARARRLIADPSARGVRYSRRGLSQARVCLYEHPACQVPRPFFFSLFLPAPFLLFDRAAGFLPPRPHIVAGRRAQMLSRLAASSAATTLWGASAFTAIEHDGRLDGSGVDYTPVIYLS